MPASYEELRDLTVGILLGEEEVEVPQQWVNLKNAVALVMAQRRGERIDYPQPSLAPYDAELLRDVFWDLFRQGHITMGMNDNNAQWPFFRLSHHGKRMLKDGSPYRFTDASTYIAMVRKHVPDLDDLTKLYLEEAVGAFYAGCLLASCVMLGVAAENRFNMLLDAAATSEKHPGTFTGAAKEWGALRRINKFTAALQPLQKAMPQDVRDDLDSHFQGIQSVIRVARNESGHPSGEVKERDSVFVFLQLFAPYARKMSQLQGWLA